MKIRKYACFCLFVQRSIERWEQKLMRLVTHTGWEEWGGKNVGIELRYREWEGEGYFAEYTCSYSSEFGIMLLFYILKTKTNKKAKKRGEAYNEIQRNKWNQMCLKWKTHTHTHHTRKKEKRANSDRF